MTITHYGTKGWKGNYHEAMQRWPGGAKEGQPMPWDVKPEKKDLPSSADLDAVEEEKRVAELTSK